MKRFDVGGAVAAATPVVYMMFNSSDNPTYYNKDGSEYSYTKYAPSDAFIGPSAGKRIVTAFALLSMPLIAIAQLIVSIVLALLFLPELCINPEMYRRCRFTPLIDTGLSSLVVWIAVPTLLIENFSSQQMKRNW